MVAFMALADMKRPLLSRRRGASERGECVRPDRVNNTRLIAAYRSAPSGESVRETDGRSRERHT